MSTTPLPPCAHHKVMTWKTDDGTPVLWSCVECNLKFEPITARADLEAENARLRKALTQIFAWNQHPSGLAVDYGSNGVRDFYRGIANAALKGTP